MSFGALVGGMIATSGDEAFVLLALVPDKALLLFGIFFVLGIDLAWVSDKIADLLKIIPCQECKLHEIHTVESCKCFDKDHLVKYYLRISWQRAVFPFSLISISLTIV